MLIRAVLFCLAFAVFMNGSALAAGYRDGFDNAPSGEKMCKYWCVVPTTPYGGSPDAYHPTDEMFDVIFRRDRMAIKDGVMTLTLDDCATNKSACQNQRFASGEYESLQFTSYGCYSGRMKAAKGSGIVSSFFLFDAGSADQIDIEFLGKDTKMIQTGYYVKGQNNTDSDGNNMEQTPLGFDASADFHVYQIEWNKDSLAWFVDGKEIRRSTLKGGPLPSAPSQLMANLWTGKKAEQFFGPFSYTGPISAHYDWVEFKEGSCAGTDLSEDAPTTTGAKQCRCKL
ncbi:MAG: family 16 glycosylhydrolase [Rickettsiales bacterium]